MITTSRKLISSAMLCQCYDELNLIYNARAVHEQHIAIHYLGLNKVLGQGEPDLCYLHQSITTEPQLAISITLHCTCRLDEETQYRGLDPVVLVESGRRLERARWHPTNDNLFATVAASDRSVYLYDAQYTQASSCLPPVLQCMMYFPIVLGCFCMQRLLSRCLTV